MNIKFFLLIYIAFDLKFSLTYQYFSYYKKALIDAHTHTHILLVFFFTTKCHAVQIKRGSTLRPNLHMHAAKRNCTPRYNLEPPRRL